MLTLFVLHTTAGITVLENAGPPLRDAINVALTLLVPRRGPPQCGRYRHCRDSASSHIMAVLVGSSLQILVSQGKPRLSTWEAAGVPWRHAVAGVVMHPVGYLAETICHRLAAGCSCNTPDSWYSPETPPARDPVFAPVPDNSTCRVSRLLADSLYEFDLERGIDSRCRLSATAHWVTAY